MKTTIEIEDALLRRAKVAAAQEGITLKELFRQALRLRLEAAGETAPAWRALFGGLADLREESRRIERWIDEEFERIEPEVHRAIW